MNALIPAAHSAGAGRQGPPTTRAVAVCHGAGAAGAPKLGDKADWGPRIAQGKDKPTTHPLKGLQGKKGFMSAKGGNAALKDDAVKASADYMVSKSKYSSVLSERESGRKRPLFLVQLKRIKNRIHRINRIFQD